MSSTFMKEESKDLFYGQFENVKSEKLEYVYETMPITFAPELVHPEHIPFTLSIDYAAGGESSYIPRRFDCGVCAKSFKYKQGLADHMKRKHGEQQRPVVVDFGCTLCSKSFASSQELNKHVLSHKKKQVSCRKQGCSQIFNTEKEMRRHVDRAHLDKKYSCRICSKMFTRVSNLNRHMKLHQNIREFPCTLCGKEFTQRVHRDKHMMIHFRMSNQCPKCDAVCTKLKYFNNHVTNVCYDHSIVFENPTQLTTTTPYKEPLVVSTPAPPVSIPRPPAITHSVAAIHNGHYPPTFTTRCPICMVGQRDAKRLRGHIINVHHVDNICPQCNAKHEDFNEFVEHLRECYREDKETSTMLTDFANSLLDNFQYS